MILSKEHYAHESLSPPTAVWEALPQTAVLFSYPPRRTADVDMPYHRWPLRTFATLAFAVGTRH